MTDDPARGPVADTPCADEESRGRGFPASAEQTGLLLVEELHPGTPAYNVPAVFHLHGELDLPALESALRELVARHESLRSTFAWRDGRVFQRVHRNGEPGCPDIRLTAATVQDTASDPGEFAAHEALRPLDLRTGPVCRARLLRSGAREHVLSLVLHHAVVDGWSLRVLLGELSALYGAFRAGTAPQLPPPGQYRDYVAYQAGEEWARAGGEALAHWRRELADPPSRLALPTDHRRPATQDLTGALHVRALEGGLAAATRACSTAHGVTPYVTLLAAYCALLHRLSGDTDLLVGSPYAGRDRPEDEEVVGYFANTLALRVDLADDPSFGELTRRLRKTVLAAFDHHQLPFGRLVSEVVRERDPSRPPLVQVSFGVERQGAAPDLPGLTAHELFVHNGSAKFDLSWVVVDDGDRLVVRAEYATSLFTEATVDRMVDQYATLLAAAVRDPASRVSELPLLSRAEAERLTRDHARGPDLGHTTGRCVDELFTAQARRTPDNAAVVHGDRILTYRELDRRSNALAHALRRHGVRTETPVGLLLDRTPEFVTAVLAVWKAGGAYVPMDPEHPDERLRFIAADTALPLLISDREAAAERLGRAVPVFRIDRWRERDEAADQGPPPLPGRTAHSLAYVIHTSGSTGRPKGTLVEHAGLANLIVAQRRLLGDLSAARILQFARVTFDASVWELVMALGHGGALCLPTDSAPLSGSVLAREVRANRATHVTTPPSVLSSLPADEELGLTTLVSAGEELPETLATRLAAQVSLVNAYGPTETTVCATAGEIHGGRGKPTIGVPIGNAEAHVLDAGLRLVPTGAVGELCVGGSVLARGYLGRPGLTAERFVPHPFTTEPGARLYRTGDLVRRLPTGELEFLGRVDRQVKIRGFRIELGELEEALRRHPNVANAAVRDWDDERGRRLAAYVEPGPHGPLTAGELTDFLRGFLPAYMIPAAFVVMDAIPVTSHGKADYAALPRPGRGRPELGHSYHAPQGATERELAQLWADVLGLDRVGATDDFFALGGSSLELVQLRDRIQHRRQIKVPMADLFRAHNIRLLAAYLDREADRTRQDTGTPAPDTRERRRDRAVRMRARKDRNHHGH